MEDLNAPPETYYPTKMGEFKKLNIKHTFTTGDNCQVVNISFSFTFLGKAILL